MSRFDQEATFGDDYLYFYAAALTDERSDAETAEIIETLALRSGSRVLDAPCGHGRIANRLAAEGIEVTGVDACELFLEQARRDANALGVTVSYTEGDLRALPADGESFDAVLCWFTSFGYFEDDDNRRVLAEYHRVLRPGGRLLIETMNRDGFIRVFAPSPQGFVTQIGDDLMVDQSTFDPLTGRLDTKRTIVRGGETRRSEHFVRFATPNELHDWLTGVGFYDVTITSRRGAPLTLDSRRLVVVATK